MFEAFPLSDAFGGKLENNGQMVYKKNTCHD